MSDDLNLQNVMVVVDEVLHLNLHEEKPFVHPSDGILDHVARQEQRAFENHIFLALD